MRVGAHWGVVRACWDVATLLEKCGKLCIACRLMRQWLMLHKLKMYTQIISTDKIKSTNSNSIEKVFVNTSIIISHVQFLQFRQKLEALFSKTHLIICSVIYDNAHIHSKYSVARMYFFQFVTIIISIHYSKTTSSKLSYFSIFQLFSSSHCQLSFYRQTIV